MTTRNVNIQAIIDVVVVTIPRDCGGVISVTTIQQIGPTPNEKEATKKHTQIKGRIDVEPTGAGVVLYKIGVIVVLVVLLIDAITLDEL